MMATLEDSRLFQELMMRLLGEDRVVISGKKKIGVLGSGVEHLPRMDKTPSFNPTSAYNQNKPNQIKPKPEPC